MKRINIKISFYDVVEFSESDIKISEIKEEYFNRMEEEKWIRFCKQHGFNHIKDINTKIYDIYLRLCSEDLL